MELIKDVQQEKATLMNEQVMMMYAIFFIFLGISIALVKFLIPIVQTQSTEGFGLMKGYGSDPCVKCVDSSESSCIGCSIFYTISEAMGFGKPGETQSYYKALFFTMIVIQGFFSGLMTGQIGSDSVAAGVKHSLIMVIAGVVSFVLLMQLGVF